MTTNFHNKNFALSLALKRSQARTRKWPIESKDLIGYLLEKRFLLCRVKAKNTDKNMKLRVRFFGKPEKGFLNPQTDFAFFEGIQTPYSRGILRIKSKSGVLRFTTSAFFLGKDLKKVLLTSGFPWKMIHNSYRTWQFRPNVFFRAILPCDQRHE